MHFLIKLYIIIYLNIINLSLELLLQLFTQEKFHKFIQRLDICEMLILGVLLKKVARKPLKISLTPCVQIFFI